MIDSFSGPNRFLSNFFIEPDGSHVEGEYQAAKSINQAHRYAVFSPPPGAAKRRGQVTPLRPDWEEVKLFLMAEFVTKKFRDHRSLRGLLLTTGDQELVEGNHWGDTFWGVCRGRGENHLGKILMAVREII